MSGTLVEHLNITSMTTLIRLLKFLQLHKKRIKIFSEKTMCVLVTYYTGEQIGQVACMYKTTNIYIENSANLGTMMNFQCQVTQYFVLLFYPLLQFRRSGCLSIC